MLKKQFITKKLDIVDLNSREKLGELKLFKFSSGEKRFDIECVAPLSPYVFTGASSADIENYLDNLLPEGAALTFLKNKHKLTDFDTFELLSLIGGDVSGRCAYLSSIEGLNTSQTFIDSNTRKLSEIEIVKKLEENKENSGSFLFWDEKPRLSMTGFQPKINVIKKEDGLYFPKNGGFVVGEGKSTHILKVSDVPNLPFNEFYQMQLAKHCGLEVAETELLDFSKTKGLLIKRFDRDIKTGIKHIIDGCQLLNRHKSAKYQSPLDENPLKEIMHLLKKFGAEKEVQKLLKLTLFNMVIDNYDAHLKNLSFFYSSSLFEGQMLALTPAYDLVNIGVLPDCNKTFSLYVGGKSWKEINDDGWQQFAEVFESNSEEITDLLNQFEKGVEAFNIEDLLELNDEEKELSSLFKQNSLNNIEKLKTLTSNLSNEVAKLIDRDRLTRRRV